MQSRYDRPANRLLAAMPPQEWDQIREGLQATTLVQGHILCESETEIPLVYFPTSGVISCVVVMEEGGTIEGILAGNEGGAGLSAAFGLTRSPWRLVVQAGGEALVIPPEDLRDVLQNAPVLQQVLIRYSYAVQQLATQSIACNRFHAITERLARWLLLMLDRSDGGGGTELSLTHEFLAQMLGTHRPSVTLALSTLEHAGLIRRAGRARIQVLDRPALEAAACECYRRVALELDRVFTAD